MTIRRTNPRKQGDIGLGAAIGWFTAQGHDVLVPLTESIAYDLAVDDRPQTTQPHPQALRQHRQRPAVHTY